MKAIVTGAAGFIGSRLARRLVADGHEVVGVDVFTPYYPRWMKLRNVAPLEGNRRFKLVEGDLNDLALGRLLSGAGAVFHLAAQAGVRASWGRSFQTYLRHNVAATQRLLEAVKSKGGPRVVYASSSSVYGATPDLPMKETSPLRPLSPYGVTKLAAEDLCFLYHKNYGLPAVSLRFFTVYGPGQRPDMAFHKFFKALLDGAEVTVYGDGRQTRDFTYVDDIVEAILAAAERGRPGEVYNLGGGHRERLDRLFPLLESITGRTLRLRPVERQKGDVPDTHAAIEKAGCDLGYRPRTSLRDGLAAEWDDIQALYRRPRRRPGHER